MDDFFQDMPAINADIHSERGRKLLVFSDNRQAAAGGTGHLRQIAEHLREALLRALEHVGGQCGCSPEKSCYGCLRNYAHHYEHGKPARGGAEAYLRWLLGDASGNMMM